MEAANGKVVIFNTTRVQLTLSLNGSHLQTIDPIDKSNNYAPVAGAPVERVNASGGTDPVFYTNNTLTTNYGGVRYNYEVKIDPTEIDTDVWLQLFVFSNSLIVLSNHGKAQSITPSATEFAPEA
ncbi:MAG TPA: hypothetical protein VGD69_25385 [Herpetosiphonaceae bacterium]